MQISEFEEFKPYKFDFFKTDQQQAESRKPYSSR